MKTSTNENKSLLYLHKYSRKAAAYRYRFELFFDSLRKNGFQIQTQSLLSDSYLESLFKSGKKPWFEVLVGYFSRVFFLLTAPKHDLKIVYMELFPQLPYFFERLFLKPQTYILELDDAYFLAYENGLNRNKVPQLMKSAKAVIVGSHFLKDYAEAWNNNVVLIPTVVDIQSYPPAKEHTDDKVTIGWMGSPSTAKELFNLKECFCELESTHNVNFLFVGSPKQELGLKNVEYRDWSEESQVQDLYEMDIGIMPLQDDQWNKGKCGFKLIQYMAAGIPVVTSAVGENLKIVSNGQTGYYANTPEQWFSAIARLAESVELRQTIGGNAVKNIKQNYSLQVNIESYLALLARSL